MKAFTVKMAAKLCEVSPYPELFAREIYYKYFRKGSIHKPIKVRRKNNQVYCKIHIEEFLAHVRNMGIRAGDLVIVHSSTEGLAQIQCNANELLDGLIELVGADGTIAFPAFPLESRLKEIDHIKVYDPKRSTAWTGMLPNLMMRRKGAIRSSFPYNPLVALGRCAEEMMRDNLESDLGHGKMSSWGYCVEHHAKVLFIGIPSYHNNTVLHVAEDFQPDFWPDGWYKQSQYYVKTDGGMRLVDVRIRTMACARYVSEIYTDHKYRKAGFIKSCDYKEIPISLIEDSYVLISSILNNWGKYKSYYINSQKLHWAQQMTKISC